MNDLTVVQATQGLCAYLLQQTTNFSVVIGFDHRHNSEAFARLAGAVFLKKGIKVFFYKKVVHTPMVPFAVDKLGCAAGIMITASHNPKQDNGYKVRRLKLTTGLLVERVPDNSTA
jgi:phosphomannomutase